MVEGQEDPAGQTVQEVVFPSEYEPATQGTEDNLTLLDPFSIEFTLSKDISILRDSRCNSLQTARQKSLADKESVTPL